MVLGTQTSESLSTAFVRQVAQAEVVEAVEIGVPLLAESASPRFVKAPSEAPPVVVECASVAEYVEPALVVTHAAAPVVENEIVTSVPTNCSKTWSVHRPRTLKGS